MFSRHKISMHHPTEFAAADAAAEYTADIYQVLTASEPSKNPRIDLIDSQPDIQWSMRPRLLGFLIEAQEAFKLRRETLVLAVSIIDRYSARRIIYARHYQLVGCVGLWLAAKFLDDKRRIPTAADLSYLCANAFAPHMFSEMERHMLDTLQWNVTAPTSLEYVDILFTDLCSSEWLSAQSPADLPHHTAMASYMCICALFSRTLIGYGPCAVATAAVELSFAILGALAGDPPGHSVRLSGTIRECFDALVAVIVSPPQQLNSWGMKSEFDVPSVIQQFFASTYDPSDDDLSSCSGLDSPDSFCRLPRTPISLSPVSPRKGSHGILNHQWPYTNEWTS